MKQFFILLFIGSSTISIAQEETVRLAWEGGSSLNYKVNDSWSGNTSLGKRSVWYSQNGESLGRKLSFIELDQFVTRRLDPLVKISLGYKYRWVDPTETERRYEHRLTQQLAWTHLDNRTRMISRFRSEQRIRTRSFAHRYRYRISVDIPLSGERLDVREFYLAISNEVLFEAVDVEENTWENRISGNLGYLLSRNLKVEFSLTSRFENLTRTVEEITFINTRAIINLN